MWSLVGLFFSSLSFFSTWALPFMVPPLTLFVAPLFSLSVPSLSPAPKGLLSLQSFFPFGFVLFGASFRFATFFFKPLLPFVSFGPPSPLFSPCLIPPRSFYCALLGTFLFSSSFLGLLLLIGGLCPPPLLFM